MIEKFQQRFVEEAGEYCDRLEQYLLELEQDMNNQTGIDEVFRIMHSLKGSGGMFGFSLLSEFTHELESLYQQVREGNLQLNSGIVGFSLSCVDVIRNLLTPVIAEDINVMVNQLKGEINRLMNDHPEARPARTSASGVSQVSKEVKEKKTYYLFFEPDEHVLNNGTNPLYLIDELNTLGDCQVEADMKRVPLPESLLVENCYTVWRAILTTAVPRTEIEDIFLFVRDNSRIEILEIPDPGISGKEDLNGKFLREDPEEVIEQLKSMQEVQVKASVTARELKMNTDDPALSTIRVDSSRIDEYMNLVSEMITAQSRLFSLAETRKDKEIEALAEHFDKLTHQMRDNAFDMSLIPLYSIVTRFRRLVRDLSLELKKEVNLVLNGLDTEVDKNVIEKLVNPMIHLIRNCIDHGIEPSEERLSYGKPAAGTVSITAGYEGNFVEIKIEDDGRGLDLEQIRKKAIEKGLLNEDDPENEAGLVQIIFKPGFTTSKRLTDVSGRGIGLDAAKKIINDLRGDITVATKPGLGTCFTIRVPLTLSIIDGLLVKIGDDLYIVPTSVIEKIYPLIHTRDDESVLQIRVFDGKQIPYLDLGKEFYGLSKHLSQQYLIAVTYKSYTFGLVVDDVLREYQAVVRPLGRLMQNGFMFMGASILGDGRVALVLDISSVIKKLVS